jgi:DNA-binding MarR family transcriptional regulator
MTEHVRWLDDEEQDAWRAFLDGWKGLEHRLDADLKAAHGITLADYEILVHLSDQDDHRLLMSELADLLLTSRSRLTYRIDRLEKERLVDRRPCEEDGRSIWAVLTPAGLALLKEAASLHVNGVRELLVDRFSREQWLAMGDRFRAVADQFER